MRRQKYFYHASPESDLKFIEPRGMTTPTNFQEGNVVFATPNLAFASMFLIKHDDSWANGGTFNNTPYFVISDKDRFSKADKGGSIYLLRSASFKKYNKYEWFSKGRQKVRDKIYFSSGFIAMVIYGVQVYIVDAKVYKKIQKANDHGLSILNSMESENEKIGYPSYKLEMYYSSKKLADSNSLSNVT